VFRDPELRTENQNLFSQPVHPTSSGISKAQGSPHGRRAASGLDIVPEYKSKQEPTALCMELRVLCCESSYSDGSPLLGVTVIFDQLRVWTQQRDVLISRGTLSQYRNWAVDTGVTSVTGRSEVGVRGRG